ncbi:hypothetical protein LCGC14_2676760, partial [marine sediment metagenome]
TERFIHEIIHEIADEQDVLDLYPIEVEDEEDREELRDLVAVIINKWERYEEIYFKELDDR